MTSYKLELRGQKLPFTRGASRKSRATSGRKHAALVLPAFQIDKLGADNPYGGLGSAPPSTRLELSTRCDTQTCERKLRSPNTQLPTSRSQRRRARCASFASASTARIARPFMPTRRRRRTRARRTPRGGRAVPVRTPSPPFCCSERCDPSADEVHSRRVCRRGSNRHPVLQERSVHELQVTSYTFHVTSYKLQEASRARGTRAVTRRSLT